MLRVLDANFNRCREGLRVIEDLLRFHLNLPLFEEIKLMRHALKEMEIPLNRQGLARRDSAGDLGRRTFAEEQSRKDISSLLAANFKRVEESLRVLEEALKLYSGAQAFQAKELRYQAYVLEQKVFAGLRKTFDLSLYLVTDSRHNALPLETVIEKAIAGGVSFVQLREKHLPDREIYELGKKALKVCRAHQVPLIIDDRADLCLALDADGLHIGQDDLPAAAVRKILGSSKIIGKSTHTLIQAAAAAEEDLDYFAFGPLFATPTKDYTPVGLEQMEEIKRIAGASGKPVVFIGGITEETLPLVAARKPNAVAVVREIMAAEDPEGAAKKIRSLLFSD